MDEAVYREMYEIEDRFWWFAAKRGVLLHLIRRFHPEAGSRRLSVCDIGCGCGALLAALSRCHDAIGIDASPTALAFCRKRKLNVAQGELPARVLLAPRSVDIVVLSDVLEHVDEDRASVVAAAGLLRPGGLLICTVPACPWLWTRHDESHHHRRRYTRARFATLFDDLPLNVRVMSYYNSFLFPAMILMRLIARLSKSDRAGLGLHVPSPPLNGLLRRVFESEKHLLTLLSLPIGGSLISVHQAE